MVPTKYPDGTLEIIIEGLLNESIVARYPIPKSKQPAVSIAVTWKKKGVVIYFNGRLVKKITI